MNELRKYKINIIFYVTDNHTIKINKVRSTICRPKVYEAKDIGYYHNYQKTNSEIRILFFSKIGIFEEII